MREKLLDLMKSEGLKPSQLAEMLEINPAGVSHILAGRNKPGFDLLQKILRRFPRINPDWLLLDSGKMYRDTNSPIERSGIGMSSAPATDQGLFSVTAPDDKPTDTPAASVAPPHILQHLPPQAKGTQVARVVIFYTDHSFESFDPKD